MRRPLLLPLQPLYRVALAAKNALYNRRLLAVRELRRPVVSVGSLSAGGAGKTPVVLMLAELLHRHGITADVLSRGFGRGSGAIESVDPAGPATRFGDEPLELARAGVSVFLGARRFDAGTLAEAAASPADLHLLDDGFQHRQLHRALDLVLLTRKDVADSLLPAGNLREPLPSLRRAGVVVLRDDEAAELAPIVRRYTDAELWTIRRTLVLPADIPSRPLPFCGIARPEGFLAMLRAAGIDPAGFVPFPDHHAYTSDDLASLANAAIHTGADGFLTTSKDDVKLTAPLLARLKQAGPLKVARLQVRLLDERAALDRLLARVPGLQSRLRSSVQSGCLPAPAKAACENEG